MVVVLALIVGQKEQTGPAEPSQIGLYVRNSVKTGQIQTLVMLNSGSSGRFLIIFGFDAIAIAAAF